MYKKIISYSTKVFYYVSRLGGKLGNIFKVLALQEGYSFYGINAIVRIIKRSKSGNLFYYTETTNNRSNDLSYIVIGKDVTQSGYVMIMALMMISLMIYSITYMITKKLTYHASVAHALDEEKATMLARGGLEIAMAQLGKIPDQKNASSDSPNANASMNPARASSQQEKAQSTSSQKGTSQQDVEKATALNFLKMMLPLQGRWQNLIFKKDSDGVDGTCQLCLMSEDGKIDINAFYDFDNHRFNQSNASKTNNDSNKDDQNLIKIIFERIEKDTGTKNLYAALETFLKNRSDKINDVTELLAIPEFNVFAHSTWYTPATQKESSSNSSEKKHPIYLTDIFTVWTDKKNVEPWLISDSLCALLDLTTIDKRNFDQEKIAELLKNFKLQSTWPADWNNQLSQLYGQHSNTLPPEFIQCMSPRFESSILSVLSYAKVGRITKKLWAIIKRDVRLVKEKVEIKNSIKKLYWL